MPPRAKTKAAAASASLEQVNTADVVLLVGKEDFLVERAVSAVLTHARTSDPQVERRTVTAGGDDTEAPMSLQEAVAPTLFGDAAVVLVEQSDQWEQQGQAALLEIATAVASGERPGMRVVVHHPGGVKARGLLDRMRAISGVVEMAVAPMKYGAVEEFIVGEFTRHKRKATSDAVAALRSSIGEDLRSLAAAIEQVCSDVEDNPITADHVGRYHAGVADVPGWEVADATWDAQPAEVVRRVRWSLELDSGATPAMTAAVASGLRQLVAYAQVRHLPDAQAAPAAGVPPFKIRALRARLTRWHPAALARATRALARADLAAKGQTEAGEGLENAQRHHRVEATLLGIAQRRSRE